VTLNVQDVVRQLPGLVERARERAAGREAAVHAARGALAAWAAGPEEADARIAAAMADDPRPYALSLAEPVDFHALPPPLEPLTVVAADGSSIEPDRFAPVPCFAINLGVVALPYGVPGEPLLESRARVGPAPGGEEAALPVSTWGVTLQRDARELFAGAGEAHARAAHGPAVLLLDGTLLPWDLDSPRIAEPVRRDARDRTREALDLLATAAPRLSAGAYISGSRAADVVTSLAALDGGPAPLEADALLFAGLLGEGERSAVFRAASTRQGRVEFSFPGHQVCFFYLRVAGDVARVELPRWCAAGPPVDRLHAAIVDQCARCDGYPRALQEAHELAVISGGDRVQFSRLLESEAGRQGVRRPFAGKDLSKRRRAI
jgi:hypothetical protein